VILVTSDYMV